MKLDTKTKAVIVFFIRKTQRRLSRPAHPIYLAASYEQSYQKNEIGRSTSCFFFGKRGNSSTKTWKRSLLRNVGKLSVKTTR